MANFQSILKPANNWVEQKRPQLIKVAIIVGVILAGGLLAPQAAMLNRIPALLFLLYLGVLGLLVLLRWPELGLFITILGGIFVPFVGPSGTNAAVAGVILTLGVWFLIMIVKERRIKFVASRTIFPLFLLIVISFVAFGLGELPWYTFAQHAPLPAQLGGLSVFVLSAAAFLVTAHLIRDLRWLEWLTWFFIALGAIYVVGARLAYFGIIERFYNINFTAESMFWTWLAALTFSQAFLNRRLHLAWRIILGIFVIIIFYEAAIKAYDWKSGWLPPLVAVAAVVGFRYWRSAIFAAPIALYLFYDISNEAVSTEAYSWGTRQDAWQIVFEIVKVNPLLGLGFANYYWYTPLFSIRGFHVQFNSHNQYVDIIAQTGILGLACVLWFFFEVGRLGWYLRERVTDGFERAYVYGVLGGLVGTLVAGYLVDWFLPFVYNIGLKGFRGSVLPWIFMGGLVAIEQIFKNREVTETI